MHNARRLRLNRAGGQPVGDDDRGVIAAWRERWRGVRREAAAKIRPLQINCAVLGLASHENGAPGGKLRDHRGGIEMCLDRIAGAGMRELEFEHAVRGQAIAGAAERDAGGRRAAQIIPEISGRQGHRGAATRRRAAPPEGLGRTREFASMMPKTLSQASNSGAGRKPNTERA